MEYTAENWPMNRASVNLTRACNLRCTYCFTQGCGPGDMSPEMAKKVVDFLFAEANKMPEGHQERQVDISFWGGEPLLRWNLLQQMARYAREVSKRTGIKVSFGGTTNGTLLTPEKFDFLDEIECKFLVSVDGAAESHNLHRKFRDGSGSHEVIDKNLKEIFKRWPDYRCRISLTEERADHFFEDMKYVADLGANFLIFSPVHEGNWTPERWEVWEEQAKMLIDWIASVEKTTGRVIEVKHFDDYVKDKSSTIWPCGAGRHYVGIDIDGAIYPCHRFNKFDDARPWQAKEVCIGHIEHGITNPTFRDKLIHWEHKCGDCPRLTDSPCRGFCYATRFDMSGKSLDTPCNKKCCGYVDAQVRVAEYWKEKVMRMREANKPKVSCICYNMCYLEGTPREQRMPNPHDGQICRCFNASYFGDGQARALTNSERHEPPVLPFTAADRDAIKRIFQDIDRRLKRIEERLGIENKR